MKILMIHPHDIYSASEPWTIRILELARNLAAKGHEVKLVYFPLKWDNLENNGIRNTEYGIQIYALKRTLGWKTLFTNIKQVIKLAKSVDIIHFQKCFYYAALPAIIAGKVLNKPIHYDWDDWETRIYHFGKPPSRLIGYYLHFIESMIPKIVDSVTYSSDNLMKRIKELAGNNIVMGKLPVGASTDIFTKHTNLLNVKAEYNIDQPLVMYLGQLHGAQYAELFIRAAHKLLNPGDPVPGTKDAPVPGTGIPGLGLARSIPGMGIRIPGMLTGRVKFMIVGDGYLREHLINISKELGIEDHIIFTGSVPHEHVPSYLKSADIAIACFEDNNITRSKSPLKIAEYMMAGKAIVASDVGEVKWMTNGAAELVAPGDVDALAGGIRKLLESENLRREMQQKAKTRSQEFTWAKSSERLLEVYNQVWKK